MLAVIVNWDTPFAVVILEHQRILRTNPGAPFFCHFLVHKDVSLNFRLNVIFIVTICRELTTNFQSAFTS